MPKKIEAIENGAYRIRHLKVDAEVGDPSTPGFKPKLRLNRWGGECFLDIDFADEATEAELEEETDGEGITKVKWKIKTADDELELEYHVENKARMEPVVSGACNQCGRCCMYYQCPHFDPALPDKCSIHIDKAKQKRRDDESYTEWLLRRDDRCPSCFKPEMKHALLWSPECGVKVNWARTGTQEETFVFDLVLKKKPQSNILVFPMKSEGLKFGYQPFLTQEDIEQGTIRPPNVEGSYAVYHINKKNNEYMTGKAFHIYRPIAEDALGNKAWCSLYINPEITELVITVPQQFLDEAVYPVMIDPDLGHTAIGGSWTSIATTADTQRAGSAWTMPAPGGTANWIKAYVKHVDEGVSDTCDCKVFINQKDSVAAGQHGQIAIKENLNCPGNLHWEQFTLAGEALTEALVYILNIDGNRNDMAEKGDWYGVAYDVNGATAVASYNNAQTYCSEESSWIVSPHGTTRDYSIYVNYTELPPEGGGGAGAVVMDTKSLILDLLLEGVID